MRLEHLPEIVGTERRVLEVVRQRIPGHRTGDGERPTAERAATMSWYDEMVAAGRSKSLTTGNVRCGKGPISERDDPSRYQETDQRPARVQRKRDRSENCIILTHTPDPIEPTRRSPLRWMAVTEESVTCKCRS